MVKCFHLSPGDNDCIVFGENCFGKIVIDISQLFPEWCKKNKKEIVTDSPFGICINKERKFDSLYNKSVEDKKEVLINYCS